MDTKCVGRDQRRIVELLNLIGFGAIEGVSVRDGSPCFDVQPRIVQTIKLDGSDARMPQPSGRDLPLKKEFENLFRQLERIGDGKVDIEVRHGLPFRLILEWPQTNSTDVPEERL